MRFLPAVFLAVVAVGLAYVVRQATKPLPDPDGWSSSYGTLGETWVNAQARGKR